MSNNCYIVTVSITYRSIGSFGEGTTITRISSCFPEPFSLGLDREADSLFLYSGEGGKQNLESSWSGFELLQASIISQEPCPCPLLDKYDCVNKTCIKNGQYNTPGLYLSLAECAKNCGGCSGKCLSTSEWSAIKELANRLKNKNCGI
jgi:hypothetical protein